MKVAIIGMGNMGCNYARMISQRKVPHMELRAITRIKEEKLNKLKAYFPENLSIYDSAAALFLAYDEGKVEIEAVIIVTPHLSHEEIALEAFSRGLKVLCDKPAGVYSRQARNMQQAFFEFKKTFPKLQFGMIFQQRTYPVYRKIKELTDSKFYGNIKRVNWTVTDWFRPEAYYQMGSWKAKWKTDGGGVILNQCPHNLDILQWICGMPSSVRAFCYEGKYHSIEVEDEATVFFQWKNGATGVFTTSTGEAAGTNRLEIVYENAYLVCENNQLRVFELKNSEQELQKEMINFFAKPEGNWKIIELENNIDSYVELLEKFAINDQVAIGEDGLDNLLISNAIYLSSWENEIISIPEKNTSDEEQFERRFEAKLTEKQK